MSTITIGIGCLGQRHAYPDSGDPVHAGQERSFRRSRFKVGSDFVTSCIGCGLCGEVCNRESATC